jgi:hypothetical protein
MMNTMMFANIDEYLDKSSSEVIISKITRGNYFLCSTIDLLKKEIDGYLKLSKHFRDYMALFTLVYREVQQELFNNNKANKIREKKYFGTPLFLFRVIVSLIKERDLATRILVRIPTQNLYAVTQHLLTRRNFIFLNSPRGFWRSLEERSRNFNRNLTLII